MGTEYVLFGRKSKQGGARLEIYEMSSYFSLYADDLDNVGEPGQQTITLGQHLTPDDLADIALKLIQCASWNGLSAEKVRELKEMLAQVEIDILDHDRERGECCLHGWSMRKPCGYDASCKRY